MKLNLKEVTFSYRGSYMAISYLEDGSRHKQAEKGLYLKTYMEQQRLLLWLGFWCGEKRIR